MLKAIVYGVISLCLMAAGFAVYYYQSAPHAKVSPDVAVLYGTPRQVADYTLIDANAQTVQTQAWQGRWKLLYFGFTFCPDACPTALSDMRHVKSLLADDDLPLDFGFISVDPARDSAERLKQYMEYFDAEIRAYSGSKQVLDELTRNVGVVYKIRDEGDQQNYLVDHSTFFVLLNDKVQVQAILRLPHDAEQIAQALRVIIN